MISGAYIVMRLFDSACDIDDSDRFVLVAAHTIPATLIYFIGASRARNAYMRLNLILQFGRVY